MAEVIELYSGPMKPWEWLRKLADELETEGTEKNVLMGLVLVNQEKGAYRLRSRRYNATRLEVIGMLYTAAQDYNSER